MLANSIDAIGERLLNRGLHTHRMFDATPAAEIANAYLGEVYRSDVHERVNWSTLVWGPTATRRLMMAATFFRWMPDRR